MIERMVVPRSGMLLSDLPYKGPTEALTAVIRKVNELIDAENARQQLQPSGDPQPNMGIQREINQQ